MNPLEVGGLLGVRMQPGGSSPTTSTALHPPQGLCQASLGSQSLPPGWRHLPPLTPPTACRTVFLKTDLITHSAASHLLGFPEASGQNLTLPSQPHLTQLPVIPTPQRTHVSVPLQMLFPAWKALSFLPHPANSSSPFKVLFKSLSLGFCNFPRQSSSSLLWVPCTS